MGKPKIYIDGREGTTGLQIYERLGGREDLELLLIDDDKRKDLIERARYLNAADIAFLCLPDAAAVEAVRLIENDRTRVIDASTAHRVASGWVYGFPELHGQREKIRFAKRVANPGCFATGFIALVRPLVELGILPQDYPLVCHALSGYTGAGKKAIAQYEDPSREEELDSPRHYAMGLTHKHLPEMAVLCGLERNPIFSPIICDYPQGMVVTVPLHLDLLTSGQSVEELRAAYDKYYKGEALVTLRPADAPSCGFLGSNNLVGKDTLQIFVNGNGDQAVLTARLDNLGKGASGAAVQNMNLMLGLDETTGLAL
ncbi:N-acetyl-gamma-glutamyl-phosphate reductase [uncultured Eubacteriales bacterium]|uniref:N-acetyl-gamma-glutamyl-phosphate reductase n=1 Tax=uncultured Eubacteriales bacterium TaxID=172733 RepID=A0A212JQZ9_9FIRM|nr:N-acetyl-gamma-glutamyl-phosphate reductase [uncultured Eubacteriales bacterium]